jgi:hypothetical protein
LFYICSYSIPVPTGHRVTARNELNRFYDGPAPEDAEAALACGGWTHLARLRARQASLHCDAEARLILVRRRRLRLRARNPGNNPGGDPGHNPGGERALAAGLATLRAAALAIRRAATPEPHSEN